MWEKEEKWKEWILWKEEKGEKLQEKEGEGEGTDITVGRKIVNRIGGMDSKRMERIVEKEVERVDIIMGVKEC